jgi:hypothetical protein
MTTSYGWDLSHFDAPNSRGAVSEGFTFFTHKAGGDALDAEIGTWWSNMKPLRSPTVLLGAYWVQYPGSPRTRADAFIARLDATCPGWRDGPFILQDDCEEWKQDPATKPGRADIEAFCDRLVERMPKLRPIVYAPPWAYHDTLRGLSYPLWCSRYVAGSGAASSLYPGNNSSYWNAYSGQVPEILQFTSSAVIAGQTTCDANAYRGTISELTALVAPGWTDDMPLTGGDLDKVHDASALAVSEFFWGAYHAAMNDDAFAGADDNTQKNWRNSKVILQKVLGGPVSEGNIIAAIAKATDVDEQGLANALIPGLAAALEQRLPSGGLTKNDIEDAVRDVLKSGVGETVTPAPGPMKSLAGMPAASQAEQVVDTRTEEERLQAQTRIQGSDPIGQ